MQVKSIEGAPGQVKLLGHWGSKRFEVPPAADCRTFIDWAEAVQFNEVKGRSRGQCVISGNVIAAAGSDSVVIEVRLVVYVGSGPITLTTDVIGVAQPVVRVPIDLTEWIDRVVVEARQVVNGLPSGDSTKATVAQVSAQLVLED